MMEADRIEFRVHAAQRMFERRISAQDVRTVLKTGVVIEDYADDAPYPSRLILGYANGRALHVVVATNPENNIDIIITVYEPNTDIWESDLKRRRK